ncbi:MAG: hypothetical protein JWM68_3663 [Verrucomicrobiales bacterium]|nr:hypothetical protein [Verrucomicrobiales bacterium]
MVKMILIGCGEIATLAHLPALVKLREEALVELVGVCDLDEQRARCLATKFNVPHFGTDWQKLVDMTKAEAVSVCLPPGPNAQVSAAAVRSGLHVICEKPPGRNAQQAKAMADAAALKPNLVTMVAFNRRFAPLYCKAKEQSLRFGVPNVFYGRFTRASLGTAPSNTAADWITSDGSHVLDLAVATIGFPQSICVSRETVGGGAANAWTIQLRTAKASAVLLFDFAAGRRLERFEWAGPGYDVVLELPEAAHWCQQGKAIEHWKVSDITQTEDYFTNYGWPDEYRAFIAAIAGSSPLPAADFRYAYDFMCLVDAILNCPAETVHTLTRNDGAEGATLQKSGQATAKVVQTGTSKVHVLQAPQSVTRFFDNEQLMEVSGRCALTMRNGEDWKTLLPSADALITGWGGVPLTKEDLNLAQNLKLVVVVGASVKSINPEELIDRGILVCNTADAIAESVAEHCLLLTLAGLRSLPEVNRQMHGGLWPPVQSRFSLLGAMRKVARHVPGINAVKATLKPLVPRASKKSGSGWCDLRGQVVGLIGWGCTARRFAQLLQSFECELLVNSDHVTDRELAPLGGRRASLGEVLAGSKVISLHKGVSAGTRDMLGAQELAMIKSGTVVVNTARAELFDEVALVERLKRGDITAALDVYHVEPLPRHHPLRKLRNVILSPHSAGSTAQCQQRVGRQALDIISSWLHGETVPALTHAQLQHMT